MLLVDNNLLCHAAGPDYLEAAFLEFGGNARVIQRRRSTCLNWSLIRETGITAILPN